MLTICSSRITAVTVHARGAWVTRALALPADLPDEEVDLVVPDLTPLADAGSVRALVRSAGRRVVSVQVALAVPERPSGPGETAARVRELGRRLDRLEAERDRLAAHRGALAALEPDPRLGRAARRPRAEASEDGQAGDGVAARVADGLAAVELAGEVLAGLDRRLGELDEEIRVQAEALEEARLADAQAASQARMGAGHPTRRVHIRLAGAGSVEEAEVAYVVPAARWWPTYTLRFEGAGEGRRATWVHDALVAQLSGEDWTGAALALSTADLVSDARLPELPARKLGRAQPRPRPAYRPPPEGLDRLFAGWDRAFAREAPPPAGPAAAEQALAESLDGLAPRDVEEEPTRPERIPDLLPSGSRPRADRTITEEMVPFRGPPVAPSVAPLLAPLTPMPAQRAPVVPAPQAAAPGGAVQTTRAAPERPPAPPPEPDEGWLDFDALTLAPAEDTARRGRLQRAPGGPLAARVMTAQAQLDARPPAGALVDVLASRGRFDHRFVAAGRADVPSDGAAHRVAVATAEAPAALRYRTAPREMASVYREAELTNPFPAPLLAGPVDVYVEGSLLVTTALQHLDRGGTLTVGLGVEERIRVARNVRTEETSAGLLGGQLLVASAVTVELASALGQRVEVEVLERLPVSDDRAVEIQLAAARPEPVEYTQAERGAPLRGGLRFVAVVPAAGKAEVAYQVRVGFPARSELVGGNRRD